MDLTSWQPLIAVAGTLGGTIFGSAFTLFLARQTRRHADNLALEAKRTALRDDRRDAIYAVLEAAQEVDRFVNLREQNMRFDRDAAVIALHHLYYRRNCLKILASPQLRSAVEAFESRMHHTWHDPLPDDFAGNVYDYMNEMRDAFMDAATAELYSPAVYSDSKR